MPKAHNPRHGSMQYWPRKRARRQYARVKAWPTSKEAIPLGFAGYKAGMTHILITDNRKTSRTKGDSISYPVTVVECPPIKIASVLFYKNQPQIVLKKEIMFKADKELERKIKLPANINPDLDQMKPEEYDDIRIKVYTQPKLTGIGKKKPELFEICLGGNKEDKLKYVKEHIGKEIIVSDIFKPGQLLDFHAVTIGKGLQGPVKRFGVSIRHHKSEKVKRGPGSLGGWKAQGHTMYRVAHAGQTGYHTRTEYNKKLLKVSDKPEEINPKGGFLRYGNVKNYFILVKGSLNGPKKRLVRFNFAIRPKKKHEGEAPSIEFISTASKQGNRY